MKLKLLLFFMMACVCTMYPLHNAQTLDTNLYWMKVKAKDKFERSVVANLGVHIEAVREDYVIAVGGYEEKVALERLNLLETELVLSEPLTTNKQDAVYHSYADMTQKMKELNQRYPQISRLTSIGKSVEGRELWSMEISGQLQKSKDLPAVAFMGGHHAREHLSVELPLRYIEYLLTEYAAGNPRIQKLVNNRLIFIIPCVNPDGMEYDKQGGKFKMWRKNRTLNKDGTYGVDLNRNYGYQWGTGGSSTNTSSEVYMGPHAFSEPETQAVKRFVEKNLNITILLSFHTYSELILYPWGHSYEGIQNSRDKMVHEKMAQTMAQWNQYTPQQSSELYIASGDTTDWSYGEQKIISFTFELDPKNRWGSPGFYPGTGIIPEVVRKNLEPVLYLIEYADNPYRVIDENPGRKGFSAPDIQHQPSI